MTAWQQIRLLLVIGLVTVIIAVAWINTTLIVYSSTTEIPTTDPPMLHDAELNGTKTIDYINEEVAHEDSAMVVISWYNFTILLDVPEYQECLTRDLHSMESLQNATEVERRAALSQEMLKATGMNDCIAFQYVGQGIEKAFEGLS